MAKQEAVDQETRGASMFTHLMVIGFSIIVFCMMFTDQLEISYSLNGLKYEGIGTWKEVLLGEYNALPTFVGYLLFGVVAILALFPLFREADKRPTLWLNITLAVISTVALILIAIIIPVYKGSSATYLCEGEKECIDTFKDSAIYSLKGGPISAIVFATFTAALQYFLIYSDWLKIKEKKYIANSKNKNIKENKQKNTSKLD